MKKLFYYFIPILFVACSSSDDEEIGPGPEPVNPPVGTVYPINGFVQKGPFRADGFIEIIELNEQLHPIGGRYSTLVSDNTGRYAIDNEIESRYVEIVADGCYFNEVLGEVSSQPTTLRAIADLNETALVNVNVLTTLTSQRIRKLVQEQTLSLKTARAQAEREVLDAFNIPNQMPENMSFAQLDISKPSETNAILLAISSTLQSDREPNKVSEILSDIGHEIKENGIIANQHLRNEITDGGTRVNPLRIRENLKTSYQENGVNSIQLPPFENYLDMNGNGVLDQDENWLLIEETAFNVSDEGGIIEVKVQHNIPYEIIAEESWITRTDATRSGEIVTDVLKFRVEPNTTYDPRAAYITVRDTNTAREEYITVSQKQKDALTLTKAKYEITQEGGTIDVEVKHNIDFTVEIAEDSKSWIQPIVTRGLKATQLKFNIAPNPSTTTIREGQIVVRSGERSETISIFQSSGKALVLNQQEYTIGTAGETITVEVTSNIKYEVMLPQEPWVKQLNPTYALATNTYTFEVLPNDTHDTRKTAIMFRELQGTLSQTVTIQQSAKNGLVIDTHTPTKCPTKAGR